MRIKINFEKPFFYYLPPEEKSSRDIVLLLMQDAAGRQVDMRKYNPREIASAARGLILNGFLRGTVLDRHKCVWSRLTQKGSMYLKIIEKEVSSTF